MSSVKSSKTAPRSARLKRLTAGTSVGTIIAVAQERDLARKAKRASDAKLNAPTRFVDDRRGRAAVDDPREPHYVAPGKKPKCPRITAAVVKGWPEYEQTLWELCGEHWPEHHRIREVWRNPKGTHALADLADAVEKSAMVLKAYVFRQHISLRPFHVPRLFVEMHYELVAALAARVGRATVALQGG